MAKRTWSEDTAKERISARLAEVETVTIKEYVRTTNLQGLGNYTLEALGRKDFMITQTMTMYIAVIVVTMNLVMDLGYAWLDPRIRYS